MRQQQFAASAIVGSRTPAGRLVARDAQAVDAAVARLDVDRHHVEDAVRRTPIVEVGPRHASRSSVTTSSTVTRRSAPARERAQSTAAACSGRGCVVAGGRDDQAEVIAGAGAHDQRHIVGRRIGCGSPSAGDPGLGLERRLVDQTRANRPAARRRVRARRTRRSCRARMTAVSDRRLRMPCVRYANTAQAVREYGVSAHVSPRAARWVSASPRISRIACRLSATSNSPPPPCRRRCTC
jgi:hypothetical protein